jgi:hypothetical protein
MSLCLHVLGPLHFQPLSKLPSFDSLNGSFPISFRGFVLRSKKRFVALCGFIFTIIPYESVWFHHQYSGEFHSFLGLIAPTKPLFTSSEKEK